MNLSEKGIYSSYTPSCLSMPVILRPPNGPASLSSSGALTQTMLVCRLYTMSALGFAIDLASHGIGTARAMSRNETAGVFAAVAMGLSGIVTALIVPLMIFLLQIQGGVLV